MRLSQSKESTKEFVALLESHLATIHPAYQRNKQVGGIRHEYFREIEDGLHAIHSVLCMRGTYYHCFCLSLHRTHTAPGLYSPFTIGGRCDHNYSVTRACHLDLGLSPVDPTAPFLLSSFHRFRKGSDRIIRRCTSEAESRLLPFYQTVWAGTRSALQALMAYVSATPVEDLELAASGCTIPRHKLSCHMLEFRQLHDSLPPAQRSAFFAATALTNPEVIRDIASQARPN